MPSALWARACIAIDHALFRVGANMTSLSLQKMDASGPAEGVESAAEVTCAHCGLPVPRGLVRPGETEQFCCSGCRGVRQLLCAAGLTRYYALRAESVGDVCDEDARQADRSDSSYWDFDTPAFAKKYCEDLTRDVRRVELYLEGVHCAACLWLVEKLPNLVGGVSEARLDFERRVLELHFRPERVLLSRIARQLDQLGYPPRPYADLRVQAARRAEERRLLMRLGVAGAVAGNVMLLSFALYSGAFQGMAVEFRRLFEISSLLVSLPALTYCAAEFYRGAYGSLKTRTPHMDLPVTLGIVAGALWGTVNVIRGSGQVYFDTVTALVFLLLVGRYLELRQQNKARESVERAQTLTPSRARVVSAGGEIREVFIDELCVGDVVKVLSGETIPVDGRVSEGISEIDNRILTGESRPVAVRPGDEVHAGATNLTGSLRVESSAVGAESRLARLMREMERARSRRAPVVRLADRVAGIFVAAVIGLGFITFLLWLPVNPGAAVAHMIALFIVACPCALGLATPLAVSAGLARAAERRILVKGGDVLESIRRRGWIVFDKTGTLTSGRLTLSAWEGARDIQAQVRALESSSSHPIARAFCQALRAEPTEAPCDVCEQPGGGIRGRVGRQQLSVGAPGWLLRQGVFLADWASDAIQREGTRGRTPVGVAADGVLVALAFFEDALVPGAAECLGQLDSLGYRLALLSGDDVHVTKSVASELARVSGRELFAEVIGGATPEAKLEYVRARLAERPVVVVGDGVNDAAALAAATVGVAVRGGAEASLLAADVYLGDSGMTQLTQLIEGAERTLLTVRRGIAISLLYNGVGVALAMTGLIGPLLAAVLMPLSSLTVVTNAYRSRSFGGVS